MDFSLKSESEFIHILLRHDIPVIPVIVLLPFFTPDTLPAATLPIFRDFCLSVVGISGHSRRCDLSPGLHILRDQHSNP